MAAALKRAATAAGPMVALMTFRFSEANAQQFARNYLESEILPAGKIADEWRVQELGGTLLRHAEENNTVGVVLFGPDRAMLDTIHAHAIQIEDEMEQVVSH